MAHMLAVDWDRYEVRFLLATSAGGPLKILAAGAAPLVEFARADPSASPEVGRALRDALSGQRLGRSTVLVALGRGSVEMLSMTLPPAKDSELPELVANEALRQLPHLPEDAVLDFMPSSDDPAKPRNVSALICHAARLEEVKRCCADAGLTPDRLVVRPFALARLPIGTGQTPPRACLLVSLVAREIDLAVLSDQRVVFARTVKLPDQADDEATLDLLLTEINRTLVVAPQSRVGEGPVEHVFVFGQLAEHQTLVERITADLSLPASVVDPFSLADISAAAPPSPTGRFAPLVGMLQDEIRGSHAVDFLHPRKPPAPPNRRRRLGIAAAALTSIVFVGGFHVWDTLQSLDAQEAELTARLRELERSARKAAEERRVAESIRSWQASTVNWLDELRDFSLRFPSSRDAVVLHMSLTPSNQGGGQIDLEGLVRDPAIVLRMEKSLRDGLHEVRSKRVQERVREKSYSWHFETNVTVTPRDKTEYR